MTKYILFRNCPRLKRVFVLEIARDIEKLTRAESAPRAVASVAPASSLLQEPRSLPLAVLIRRPNARL